MTLLSWPQKSCLVEIRKGFWRYAGLGEDSANSVVTGLKLPEITGLAFPLILYTKRARPCYGLVDETKR